MPPYRIKYLRNKYLPPPPTDFACSIFFQETAAPSRTILPFGAKSDHLAEAVKC